MVSVARSLSWGVMSEIPYYFETPIPKYFRENGWFSNPKTILFVSWAFSKCSPHKRTIVHDGKEITLEPYEFITGRRKSADDCCLTENSFRHQLNNQLKAGLLKKTTNSTTNRFNCYIWVTERFCKSNNQQNNQQTTNKQPTEQPQSRREKIRSKEDHPSIPSDPVLMIDDFSSEKEKEEKEEIIPGIFLSAVEMAECVKVKGDIEKVKYAIGFIQGSSKRKHPIADWPNALARWKIPNKAVSRVEDSLAYTEKLCREFEEFKRGWRCYMYTDHIKDERGLLFESESPYQKAVFFALADGELQAKSEEFINQKQLRKK